eukprot:1200542-Rhodomonas_salina.1
MQSSGLSSSLPGTANCHCKPARTSRTSRVVSADGDLRLASFCASFCRCCHNTSRSRGRCVAVSPTIPLVCCVRLPVEAWCVVSTPLSFRNPDLPTWRRQISLPSCVRLPPRPARLIIRGAVLKKGT